MSLSFGTTSKTNDSNLSEISPTVANEYLFRYCSIGGTNKEDGNPA